MISKTPLPVVWVDTKLVRGAEILLQCGDEVDDGFKDRCQHERAGADPEQSQGSRLLLD